MALMFPTSCKYSSSRRVVSHTVPALALWPVEYSTNDGTSLPRLGPGRLQLLSWLSLPPFSVSVSVSVSLSSPPSLPPSLLCLCLCLSLPPSSVSVSPPPLPREASFLTVWAALCLWGQPPWWGTEASWQQLREWGRSPFPSPVRGLQLGHNPRITLIQTHSSQSLDPQTLCEMVGIYCFKQLSFRLTCYIQKTINTAKWKPKIYGRKFARRLIAVITDWLVMSNFRFLLDFCIFSWFSVFIIYHFF